MNGILVAIEGTGLLIVLIGGYASARALAKARGVEESVALLTSANEGLRQANNDLKIQQLADRETNRNQLHAQELDCSKQIAELRGQVDALTGNLAERIVRSVALELGKGRRAGD